ncbi:MAG: Transcriptional regulator Bxe_A3143, LysR family [uncultured Paraburkholderia sp.]|nr:MAG: Transcriptional regulator Bxe_A3143, LysR family [uncultured Paraburkholderia sp.]CAH2936743.1 MAG: Transcriptional regulator Bxe_A3143, LysR family [uncultured Paraburkholderia sp.]
MNDLMYFSQVVEHGGFSAAERVLGISKSRLSRRLTELEAHRSACVSCSAPRASWHSRKPVNCSISIVRRC